METTLSEHAPVVVPPAPLPRDPRPATVPLAALGGVAFLAHMLVSGNYGYFRDELYYIADGHHLQAGYVDQPLLMGWLAALLRVVAADNLIAIHIVPALAAALLVVVTGVMAGELGGGRTAQLVAGAASLCCVAYLATGSIFSMDVLDELWWALAALILVRLLRRNAPRLWLLLGLVIAVAFLTKLTVLFLCLALACALLVTPERRYLLTAWPWLAAGIGFLGLLPYLLWNAANSWPTWEFWHHYGGVGTDPLTFFGAQIGQMNPIALPLAAAGLVFYFGAAGARYRVLGWTFVFLYLMLTLLRVKSYFLAPAYPLLFAPGAVLFERFRPRPALSWIRPVYLALLVLGAIALAPDVMPILPAATLARVYPNYPQVLADRFGWDGLTRTVEGVYAALPPAQRARACVLASNYGEAGALQQLAAPGSLPPVLSGHNNYFLWGPGACTGSVLILVGFGPSDLKRARTLYTHATQTAVQRCRYCVSFEQVLPIYVLSSPRRPIFPRSWPSLKHYD